MLIRYPQHSIPLIPPSGNPAAFTREMTRILRETQNHPLIAQMMKPAESSDPPPANIASSSTGSRDKPCTSQSVQFQ